MPTYGSEFSPELDDKWLTRMMARYEQRGAADIGRARGEAIARGAGGDALEGSLVGSARTGLEDRLADLSANTAFQRAGLQREERLIGEGREFDREGWRFQAEERNKDRSFQERMAHLGYQFESDAEAKANRRGYQSLPGKLAAYTAASWLSRPAVPGGG